MDVLLDSCLLGSQKNLLISPDGFTWTDKIDTSAWHFNGDIKNESMKCWDTVMRLSTIHSSSIPTIPAQYVKMMTQMVPDISPPWSMILPQSKYKRFFNDIVEYVKSNSNLSTSYYENVWVLGNKILNALKPAKVDGTKINDIISASAMNSQVVESFRPRSGGYTSPIRYDRFGTVTGRLIVESGPNILLLKKEYRNVIKPSSPGGSIVSLDFSSLEARILLYESGNDCPNQDLYSMLADRFGGMPRTLVKAAVLSVLYGSSRSMVALSLGVSETKVAEVISKIENYIDTKTLLKRLKSQFKSDGYITNKFGRKIKVERPQDNIFINYYAQSTGVDVSLMGFSSMLDKLGTDGIRPLFVLHDALILDVREDRLIDVEKIQSVNVSGYVHEFPLKLEKL